MQTLPCTIYYSKLLAGDRYVEQVFDPALAPVWIVPVVKIETERDVIALFEKRQ